MAVIAGDLVTRLGVDGRKFQSGLSKARGETRSFAADVTKIVSGIALYDIGKSAVTSVFGLARETVNLAATAETAAVQFKVLTGSASSAAAVMDEINKFAADTPFESMEITQAAKQLIAFGGSAGTVIGELRTLGDLSAGMGIPLTELAEIYGKARIQGRLFMEDINQLQGRGINISAELAKEFGNVREAVEKGQVNFGHLERALKAMTSEGGAFAGMMQDMSKTFEGQTSTLLDNIKAIGRDIGEMILPRLTEMVDQSNKVLAAFNALGDARWKFLGDVLVASFDVAIETIKIHWKQMLSDMTKEVSLFSVDVIPGVAAARNAAAGKLMPERAGGGLPDAQKRLGELLGRLAPADGGNNGAAANADPMQAAKDAATAAGKAYDAAIAKRQQSIAALESANAGRKSKSDTFLEALDDPTLTYSRMEALKKESNAALAAYDAAGAIFDSAITSETNARIAYEQAQASLATLQQAKGKEDAQSAFTSGMPSLFGKIKGSASGGLLSSLKMGAEGMLDRAKIQGGAMLGSLQNWFDSPNWEKNKASKQEPQLAGAMAAGSQEAFSTIFAAMLQRGKDPNVQATEKQTRELKKALKENKPQMMLAMGAVNP